MRTGLRLEARRELDWLCRQGLEWPTLVEETSRVIRRAVPHERFCFHTIDPATGLLTGGLARNLERGDGYPAMLRNEYTEADVNKWEQLAAHERPVGSLSAATGGRLERSARYRELLRPQECAWELRASLVSRKQWWGAIAIYRSDGEPDFTEPELDFVAEISASLAEGFRCALVVGSVGEEDGGGDGPGLILFDDRGQLLEVTDAASAWLAELRGADAAQAEWLPVEVYAVALRAGDGAGRLARARVRAPSGRWLALDGVSLGSARTAVIIQAARGPEILALIVQSHGLTGREREITELTLAGLSTAVIAARLQISPYTVQDHLKAIFEKVGVRSRRELVARIFYEQHFPRIMAGEHPDASGALGRPRGAGLVRL